MQEVTSVAARHLTEVSAEIPKTGPAEEHEEKFVPKGAVAFFLLMIVIYAGMWFSMYFNLIKRH